MLTLTCASFFNRKAEESLPVSVCLFMILLYLAGIAGVIAHVLELIALYVICGSLFFILLSVILKKQSIKGVLSSCFCLLRSPGILFYLLLTAFFSAAVLHMRVTNWDDLHYWAIFPKNMAMINGVPSGDMECTFYRDYFPVVQYLYYPVFRLTGGFSEPAMFAVNYALIFLFLLPLFTKRDGQSVPVYVASLLSGTVLPFACTFQMLHCLGVDSIMTFLFGVLIIYVFDEKRDLFYFLRILILTTTLTLMKTTAVIFSSVVIALFFVKNLKRTKRFFLSLLGLLLSNGLFYMSWKVFCRIKGNTTYLSDNLSRSLGKGGIVFPSYTADTVKHFIKALFTLPLNGGRFGMSAMMMLLILIIASGVCLKRKHDRSVPLSGDIIAFITLMIGLAGYLCVMLYTYLFVFEPWEAETLSSFDRYITTYFGALLYFAVFLIIGLFTADKEAPLLKSLNSTALPIALSILLAATVNYPYIGRTLIPSGFAKAYGDVLAQREEIDKELAPLFPPTLSYGSHIIFVDGADTIERAKTIPYCSVPYVARILDAETYDILDLEAVREEADDFRAEYVVFLNTMKDKMDGELSEYSTDVFYRLDEDGMRSE